MPADASLRIYVVTGAPFSTDGWTMTALDTSVPWCGETVECHRHRRRGPHLDAERPPYRLELVRGGHSIDVVRFLRDSDVITDIRDHPRDAEVLRGIDAVLFVVECRESTLDVQPRAVDELFRDLTAVGRDPRQVPVVFVLDRADLAPDAPTPGQRGVTEETAREVFRWPGPCDYLPAVSHRRQGVQEALDRAIALAAPGPAKGSS